MIIDCISDLHGHYPKLEGGDLLIVAGDLTACDDEKGFQKFRAFIMRYPSTRIIVICGNHDQYVSQRIKEEYNDCWNGSWVSYLEDSGTEFEGVKIWGSPWTAYFEGINPHCAAFTLNAGCDTDDWLAEKWALIPDGIDILITHSPPYGIFDYTDRDENVGSPSLRHEVLTRIKPKLHVFGHIHECGGKIIDMTTTTFANASIVNERYEPVNKPIRIEI